MAGRVAQHRQILHVDNIPVDPGELVNPTLLIKEGVVSYYAAPLIAQGKVKGVIEIFHRSLLEPDDEWLNFLETLAGQAAIAIENTTLFEDLQKSNDELSKAYDSTIEGWSYALDLRDKETEGHTRRVTELTLELAKEFDFTHDELLHIRRGGLLHDIGKMGVPDRILLKATPLTPEEWVQMKQHPVYAHEMLQPIEYLHEALDIPYCHHEKWDGSGYPRGLKGEEIPLAARIFAVVDVWDAITSDRPYRAAWDTDKALTHIKQESGRHFDPHVVDLFTCLIEQKNREQI
jgi:putative nucleotidyltransferase with HDIG domain